MYSRNIYYKNEGFFFVVVETTISKEKIDVIRYKFNYFQELAKIYIYMYVCYKESLPIHYQNEKNITWKEKENHN